MKLYLLLLGCVLLGFVYSNPLQDNCKCKDTGNCADELENCQEGCDKTCRKCMITCVKNQDNEDDALIATKFNSFMQTFKCCFQKLTACIHAANLKKKDYFYDYDSAILGCSAKMMVCTAGKMSKKEYLLKAPPILRGMLQEYGKCKLMEIIKPSKCVLNYHENTEQLLGRDCLNKYVHCVQDKTAAKLDVCPSSDALKTCITDWNKCMKPKECPAGPSFLTLSIKDAWGNCIRSTEVIPNIRCIFTNLIKDGKIKLMLDKHIRAGCAVAYCGDIKDMRKNYKACAKSVEGRK